jgi:hypothetical protein
VPLGTDKRHVAEAMLRKLVREREEESLGLLARRPLRDSARRPIAEHLEDYLADLKGRRRSPKHIAFTRNRIMRLCKACGWVRLGEVNSDGFNRWRANQTQLGPKTLNEYLGHISAFLSWLLRNGRISLHPL